VNTLAPQGGSTLAAVMLLLLMGLLLLTAQQKQLDSALLLATDQQRYLKAYNQAASALSWGLVQPWPRVTLSATEWYCLQTDSDALSACARLSARPGVIMLRGQGDIPRSAPLWLYQLTTEASKGETIKGETISLQALKGGWLDFCPEKRGSDCAE
jgi:hypothetical protein